MTRHAEMERPDPVREAVARVARYFRRSDAAWDAEIDARMGKHEAPSRLLDDAMVPVDYTPKHRAGVAS